ncbi:hypothetical protein ACQR1I_09235 [Bradyrhizobium sp. HKCCYLS2038]|uniref:hypothetical protein n=1 Tax=unclassified Bradyrhizobium TaxID=2631580 RepID=UPI003EB776D3
MAKPKRSRRLTLDDIDRIVSEIDDERRQEHSRSSDRPDSVFLRNVNRPSVDVRRAKGRLRTAAWRSRMDQARVPDTNTFGRALVYALVTSSMDQLTELDRSIVGRALLDLRSRGYDVVAQNKALRRLRNRLVDPADRQGEPDYPGAPATSAAAKAIPF